MTNMNNILEQNLDVMMDLFTDNYLSMEFHHESFNKSDSETFAKAFKELTKSIIWAQSTLEEDKYKHIVQLNLQHDVPYIVFSIELGYIKDYMISKLLEKNASSDVIFICKLFEKLTQDIAHLYLQHYIERIRSRNKTRLLSLSDFQKNIMSYYEEHIRWLDTLVTCMEKADSSIIPEIDSTKCSFGQWLNHKAKYIISDKSKIDEISSLHNSLHFIASKIDALLKNGNCDCHSGMSYLEKAEFLSLQIGTELALVNNKIIMSNAAKDPLTKLLNRELFQQIFDDQYEIAYVTQKPFVLAMCDLDHFKIVNDTHGHRRGDIILTLFSNTLREQLRSSDLIFRYGGDEFVIILPASSKKNAHKVFTAVSHSFKQKQFESKQIKTEVTLSVGLLEINPESLNMKESKQGDYYVEMVDKLLYRAKNNGRDRIELYDSSTENKT